MGRWLRVRSPDWRWWLGLAPAFLKKPARKRTITVIIPAYNEERSIAATVMSVRCQRGVRITDIIVVDDCSTDHTAALAVLAGARVLRTPQNQGTKAMAQNFALARVTTELAITIDADTLLHPDAVARTLPYFNDPRTASVCGFVIPQRITTVWERGRLIDYLFGTSIFKSAQNHMRSVMVSSGCFSVFRMDIFRKLGGLKPRTMAEDMDFTWETTELGYRSYCAPTAYCYPLDPPTGRIFVHQLDRWYRGFFQNIAIHRRMLLRSPQLAAFVYGYVLEGMLSPLILVGIIAAIVLHAPSIALSAFLLEISIVGTCAFIAGIRAGMAWRTFVSIPAYFVIRPVTAWVFWRSLYREWISGDRLTTWNKGH